VSAIPKVMVDFAQPLKMGPGRFFPLLYSWQNGGDGWLKEGDLAWGHSLDGLIDWVPMRVVERPDQRTVFQIDETAWSFLKARHG